MGVGVVKSWVWFVVVPKISFEKLATNDSRISTSRYIASSVVLCHVLTKKGGGGGGGLDKGPPTYGSATVYSVLHENPMSFN